MGGQRPGHPATARENERVLALHRPVQLGSGRALARAGQRDPRDKTDPDGYFQSAGPGSNQRALIRVIATDGVNTGSVTSGLFSVQSHAPVVHIATPSDQAFFTVDSQIILMGSARDTEDGPLGDQALTWLVDGRPRGAGHEAAVSELPPGIHTIRLEAVDSDGNTAAASVTIRVVDGMPVAGADSYSTGKNAALSVGAPGVLGNDFDAEGAPLGAVLVSTVTHGTLALNADGSFTYIPGADFAGVDRFTYKATNGTAGSNIVNVSLAVGEFSTPPQETLPQFTVVGLSGVEVAEQAQIIGDIASNATVRIGKAARIVGAVFGDVVFLGEWARVEGNASATKINVGANATMTESKNESG